MKEVWKFSFSNGALGQLKSVPETKIVKGKEQTFIPLGEPRGMRRAIKAAIAERFARELPRSGIGTYEEEDGKTTIRFNDGKITIEFNLPGSETS